MIIKNKNSKIIKTILFASLIAALILPFSGINFADAQTDKIGKDIIKKEPKNSDIPLFNERETLLKKYNSLENESDKADVKKQVDTMTAQIQDWYDEKFDQAKYDEFVQAKKMLQVELEVLKEDKGELEAYEILPWVSRSYDYENNALEIRIQTKYFTEENIPKYIKTIRSIVGDKIDLTVGPDEAITLDACTSRATGECEPIQGGVRFKVDNLNIGSVGFKATYNGKTGFVTAGHNFINTAGYQMGGTIIKQSPASTSDIGNKIAMSISKGVPTWCDCAVVEENSIFRSMDDGVYGMSDPNVTENPYFNQVVTMSGGFSGLTSGIVSSTNVDYVVDLDGNGTYETSINDAIRGGYSSQAGDSGSPIISYSGKLVGIHVASTGVFMSHSAVTNTFPGLTWGF